MFLCLFFEIVIISIFIGISYFCYQKGILGLAIRPVKVVASLFLASALCGVIRFDKIVGYVLSLLPDSLLSRLLQFNLSVSNFTIKGICFLIFFLFLKFALGQLFKLLAFCFFGGIIGWVNRLLGLLVGFCFSIMAIYVFVGTVDCIFGLDGVSHSEMISEFNGGPLYNFFDN